MISIGAMASQSDQSDSESQPHEQRRFYDNEVDARSTETDEFVAAKEEVEHEEDNTYFEQEVRLRTFSLSF